MRFLRQSLMGLFLLAVTVGLLAAAVQIFSSALSERMNREARPQQQRERVFTVNVQLAEPATVVPKMAVFGEVQSQRTLDIRAGSGGTLVSVDDAFRDGGRVQKGQLLAQLDTDDTTDALARSQSDLSSAMAEVGEAARALEIAKDEWAAAREQMALRERALERQRDLEGRGVGTAAAIEAAELNLANAKQQELARRQSVSQAEARIDQVARNVERAKIAETEAARRLEDRQIFAEFDGTLSDVAVVRGGLVSANERLARLIDQDALEVSFRVSISQYARLLDKSGSLRDADVEVALDVSGLSLRADGQVSRDSAAVGEGQTGRLMFASLKDARGLKPGDFVSVFVDEVPLANAVALPSSALDSQSRVMVIGEGERLEAVPVSLLRRQGDQVLVSGDAIAGKLVVTRLTPLLGAGIRVNPIGSAVPPPPEEPALVELTDERRAKLLAFVEANQRMPADRKARILEQLAQPAVPVQVVDRLEQRMGG